MNAKKISLRGISEILSEKEMKNVMGGSGTCYQCSSGGSGYITGNGSDAFSTFLAICSGQGSTWSC